MVDNTLVLSVKPAEISDYSTSLLKSYQLKNAANQNQMGGITLEAARAKQGALSDYSMRAQSGDPRAHEALAGQPEIQAQVFQNMTSDRENRIRQIADAAKAVYPLQGRPEFKEAWAREVDALYKNGAIPEATHKQWRDTPSEIALNQALTMGAGLDAYLKTEAQTTARKMADGFNAALEERAMPSTSGAPVAAAPRLDTYAANLRLGESGNRNIAAVRQPGAPMQPSAFGPYGIDKGTWAGIMRNNPDLGLTEEDRFRPEKQDLAEPRLRRENALALMGAKINPTDRNLAMAHFLGAPDAKRFLPAVAASPDEPAINFVSPAAAAQNHNVFYSPGGQPKTVRQVYENQTHRYGDGMGGFDAVTRAAVVGTPMTINDKLAHMAPSLVKASMVSGLPEGDRKNYLELAKIGAQYAAPTEREKDYQSYEREEIAAGRTPLSRQERAERLARAGAMTIDQKNESALEGKRGEGLGSRLNEVAKQGGEARQNLLLVGRLGTLLETSGTGSKVAFTNWVRETLGPEIANKTMGANAGDIEASNALINYLIPRMRVAGTGTTSDRDMASFQASLPSLLSDPEGKRLVIQTLGGMYQYQAQAGEIAEQWQTGELSAAAAVKKLREMSDPFTAFREYQEAKRGRAGAPAQTMPSFATQADVEEAIRQNKLAPGDKFLIGSGPKAGHVGTVPGSPRLEVRPAP